MPVPPAFGRGVIVAAGNPVPEAWSGASVIKLGPAELEQPEATVEVMRAAWASREPVVIELGIDPAVLREPVGVTDPPYELDPVLDFPDERLHFYLWANNYDARDGEPIWWWGKKAERLGAVDGGPADVTLADGRAAWIDGGPRWSVPGADEAAGEPAVVHANAVELGSLEPAGIPAEAGADLAPDQLAAVSHDGGPVRVIAPAGSGKTRVLTERMRHLLGDRGYDRDQVLAVAYNKEAQRELEARLFKLGPRTRTLNSLGLWIVGEYRGERPRMLTEMDVRRIAEETFPIPRQRRANTDPVGPYLDAMSLCRLGLIPPAEVEGMRDDVPGFAEGFGPYRERLGSALDFDEQIYGALEALLRDGVFRRRMQLLHRHLLVDEFQDLTPAHVLMIRLLSMPAMDVFGVGDDDQTIYDHAGADPRFLIDYPEFFPGAKATALEVNYRCAEGIVDGARTLLGYNKRRIGKQIHAGPGVSAEPGSLTIRTDEGGASAEALVELVREWRADGVAPDQVAVLTRVNSLLLAPQIALWSAGVPIRARVGAELLDRTGVAAALAWIRVAVDPDGLIPNDLELIRRRPSRGFPNWISKWLVNCRSLADIRAVAKKIDDARVADKMEDMHADLATIAAKAERGENVRGLLEFIRDVVGLGGAMEMLDGSKGNQSAASHLDDLEALIQVADLHPDPQTFEPWLRASLEDSKGDEGITLSTVHRVKGREWDRVVVFGVSDGLFPHRLNPDAESERRVLHVAVTRARDRCAVLGDAGRPSPFLDELTGKAEKAAVAATPEPKAAKQSKKAPAAELDESDPVVAALRSWRTERAKADDVPAYVVLSNRHLAGIAAAKPTDEDSLLACDGIGPSRYERYGEEILEVLAGAG